MNQPEPHQSKDNTMSDRPCNYCTFQQMKRTGHHIANPKQREDLWDAEMRKENLPTGDGVVVVNKQGEFASWFMELPSHCCC